MFAKMKLCWYCFSLTTDTELAVLCTTIENGGYEEWQYVADVLDVAQTRQRELAALACTRNTTQMQR